MFVYRNIALKYDDFGENSNRLQLIEEMPADEFMVMDLIPTGLWLTEDEVVNKCHSSSFFSRISKERINVLLDILYNSNKLERDVVETDANITIQQPVSNVFTTEPMPRRVN